MKPVVQLERTGCGIASVAALAGVSYRQAQRVANRLGIFAGDSRLWSETHHVRRLLKEYGIRSASTEVPFTKNGIVRSGIGWCFGEGIAGLSCSTRSAHFVATCAPTSVA
jgi:triphosphoribosyl-dephospho-CoA synthetase